MELDEHTPQALDLYEVEVTLAYRFYVRARNQDDARARAESTTIDRLATRRLLLTCNARYMGSSDRLIV